MWPAKSSPASCHRYGLPLIGERWQQIPNCPVGCCVRKAWARNHTSSTTAPQTRPGNFTNGVGDDLRANGIRHVLLVTSSDHMERALLVGRIVAGSRGIGAKARCRYHCGADCAPFLRAAAKWRDGLRALVWVISGPTAPMGGRAARTGAAAAAPGSSRPLICCSARQGWWAPQGRPRLARARWRNRADGCGNVDRYEVCGQGRA